MGDRAPAVLGVDMPHLVVTIGDARAPLRRVCTHTRRLWGIQQRPWHPGAMSRTRLINPEETLGTRLCCEDVVAGGRSGTNLRFGFERGASGERGRLVLFVQGRRHGRSAKRVSGSTHPACSFPPKAGFSLPRRTLETSGRRLHSRRRRLPPSRVSCRPRRPCLPGRSTPDAGAASCTWSIPSAHCE